MGAFMLLLGTLHYMGLYMQLSVCTRQAGHGEIQNHISGNAMFTEVPHDTAAQRGQDVEMACSFRGAGTPSYSLEIQWWYIRNHVDWTDTQPWTTNEVAPEQEMPKDATKISVVKVVGSNISHKLRLSRVKPSDEGTYECRVIDFSDEAGARHHRVRAYLQVVPESDPAEGDGDRGNNNNFEALDDTKAGQGQAGALVGGGGGDDSNNMGSQVGGAREHQGGPSREHHHHQSHGHHQELGRHHGHSHSHSSSNPQQQQQLKAGKELRKRDVVDSNQGHNDCTNEPSCTL